MQSLADMVNGSISDPLAHPGQISSFGRLNGNPVFRANGFLGGVKCLNSESNPQ